MLQEVILIPYEKNGWEKWGVFFADNFIGTSAFAQQCSLLNKEAVKFRFDKKKNLLQAFADETLLFENSALGYKIKYDLISFEYDFTQRLFVYKGYPFFEEMQTSRKGLQRRWAQRREDAYKGSLMQFMRSLYRNRLVEDGFQVRRLIKIPDAEKKRVRDIYRMAIQKPQADGRMMISNAFDAFPADTAAYYRQVLQEPDKLNVLIDRVLPGDSIAYAVDSVTAGLYFTEHLQVIYPSKNMPDEFFSKYVVSSHPVLKKPVTSEATIITGQPINVLANGSYYEGTGLIISGYWGWWEKIGNMLPYNYEPLRPLKNKGTYFIKRPSDYHFWK
ncbi:hypothetical protein [Sediminibacterium soli]|uniref:hypothetical protein n=1 Tax=Sediminibacterium soli TaxID=2698829 RepID=UPI001F17D6CC|nr:hypothetical protein [Sediminibacterium soli]